MEKLILLGAFICSSLDLQAQGTVNFGNNAATAVTNVITLQRVPAGNTFTAQLWYAPDTGIRPTEREMQPLGATTGISPIAGIITGGTRTTPGSTAPGESAWFQIRVWESAYGNTWDEALNNGFQGGLLGLIASSNIIKVKTGDPTAIPPGVPASLTAAGLTAPVMLLIPEPSVISFGLLGVAACIALRRRKG